MSQKGQTQVLILAGILLLIAAAGGIFYLGRTSAPKPQNVVISSSTIPTPQPTTTSSKNLLKQPDSQTPPAGICAEVPQDNTVTITTNEDTPTPRCVKVTADQRLKIVNNTSKTVNIKLADINVDILSGKDYTLDKQFGEFLAPGVHSVIAGSVSGFDIWLQVDETANWKTYTNTEYKFGFKYPPNWTIKETTYPVKNEGWLFAVLINPPSKNSLIDITIGAEPKKTINTLASKEAVKSKMGEIVVWEKQFGDNGKVFTFPSVINNQVVQVVYAPNPQSSEEESSFMNQVLSTFRFTP